MVVVGLGLSLWTASLGALLPSGGGRYDYIIVGGGTAGCVLANRLSADPTKEVLLLEPGPSPRGALKVAMPVALTKLFFSKWDHCFESTPTAGTANRPVHLARGKALGGSSAFNALLYHRGAASDFDGWGLDGWGSDDMLSSFLAAEGQRDLTASRFHNQKGPVGAEFARYDNPLSSRFVDAAQQAGYARNDDFNDWSTKQEGVGRFQLQTRRGRRAHSSATHLRPARSRSNLHVQTGVRATRINLSDDGVATGVAFVDDDGGGGESVARVVADGVGEVLLCAGAVSSPHLLMLSGIGPSDALREKGIRVAVDVPGVGRNLADHPAVVSGYQITQPIAITDEMFIAKGVLSPRRVAEWLYRGSGPCATTGCDTGGFFSTRAGLQQPDLQMRFVCGLGTSPDGVSSYRDIGRQGKTPSGITLQSLAIRPQARGTVTLRSRDPSDPPLLDVGYGTSPADLATLRAGLRIAREIVMQPAFESVRGEEAWPRLDLDDDAALDDYIASTVHSGNALAGSCKMGRTTSDPMAVVSSEDLRVRGVANLRVVDASILPTMPGGQLGATVFAIAERAADMILSGAGELQRSREAATPQ